MFSVCLLRGRGARYKIYEYVKYSAAWYIVRYSGGGGVPVRCLVLWGEGTCSVPSLGYLSRLPSPPRGWGVPRPLEAGGVPPPLRGWGCTPPPPRGGGVGSRPLVVTQEDFLIYKSFCQVLAWHPRSVQQLA